MARTALTLQDISIAGLNITAALAAANVDGNSFTNVNGDVLFYAVNGSGGAITITFQTPGTVSGGTAIAEHTVSVGAGKTYVIGRFGKGAFNQSSGVVNVDYSAVTSLSVAVINVKQ